MTESSKLLVGPAGSCLTFVLKGSLEPVCRRTAVVTHAGAKQLHFNKNGEAMKQMQAGVDKLATVVGVTLGPKVILVVLLGLAASPPASLACPDLC